MDFGDTKRTSAFHFVRILPRSLVVVLGAVVRAPVPVLASVVEAVQFRPTGTLPAGAPVGSRPSSPVAPVVAAGAWYKHSMLLPQSSSCPPPPPPFSTEATSDGDGQSSSESKRGSKYKTVVAPSGGRFRHFWVRKDLKYVFFWRDDFSLLEGGIVGARTPFDLRLRFLRNHRHSIQMSPSIAAAAASAPMMAFAGTFFFRRLRRVDDDLRFSFKSSD